MDIGIQFQKNTAIAVQSYTASGDSGPLTGYGIATALRVHLICTARSGTNPTLDVVVEDTLDGTNYIALGSFTQVTASGNQAINIIAPLGDTLRVRYVLGGTNPNFTFGVFLIAK